MPELTDNDALYTIGALAKMVSISTDTLRYYDEIGLFKPIRTSSETGYRYYTADQAADLARIMELKYYGFSLSEIKNILSEGEINLTDAYLTRYRALENEKKKVQEAIDELSKKIKQRQGEFVMNKKILIVDDVPFMRSICKDLLTREGYKVHAVMISAVSQARMIAEAILAGAKEFISKPFQPEDLFRRIKKSSYRTTAPNYETAQKIYNAGVDDTYILTAQEVEMIIDIIHSQAGTNEVDEIILRLKERSTAEQHR